MIRLFTENAGQANPNLPLRWCVDRGTLEELKKKGVTNPQLLLIIARRLSQGPGQSQEAFEEIERKLISLDQGMEWLEFGRPGPYTIYATIVWSDEGNWGFKTRTLLRKGYGRFEYGMVDYDGEFSRTRYQTLYDHSLDEGSLNVVVAENLFAKEPPAWLGWWVCLWFESMQVSKPTNQCSFRRRAILAFTVQPIPVFVWALLKSLLRLVAAVVLVLCGHKGVSFKPVIHPFKLGLANVWLDMGPSVFLEDKHGNSRSLAFILFMPIIPVGLFIVLFIAGMFFHFSFWLAVVGAVGLVVGALVLILLAYFLIYVGGLAIRVVRAIWQALSPPPSAEELERRRQAEIGRSVKKAAERARKEKERRERGQREFEEFYEGLQDVACIGVPLEPKVELLPKRRQTVHLRFRGLKVSVCKQYPH